VKRVAQPMPAMTDLDIHPSPPGDRQEILELARATQVFNRAEEDTVLELLDAYRDDPASGYLFLSARRAGTLVGFACWGETALTEGAYDLYWLCTLPDAQRRGVGRALFERVQSLAAGRGGRLIVIWTSSTGPYAAAARFYERMGCALMSRVPDFYKVGDDLLVYVKYFDDRAPMRTEARVP
jgi:ribosomal protein S18 acetylase RimI-like enzyme